MIPCYYDLNRAAHRCRMDGKVWEWPFAAHWKGDIRAEVDPGWVRANAEPIAIYH